MSHDLQERYSSLVLAKLRASLVLRDGVVFNNDYEGNPTAGAVNIPVRDGEVTVSAYDKATGLAPTAGSTTYLNVPINKDKGVNEIIDGYDAAAVPDNLVADRLDSAGYSLAAAMDTDGGTELLTGGTPMGLPVLNTTTIYGAVVDARTALSKANVPNDGKRYLLVTPDTYAIMLKDTLNFIRQGDLSQALVASGVIGQYAGFNLYEWNDSTANLAFIAGHPKFATRVYEWGVPVKLVDLDGSSKYIGASAVKGRMVYAHKVLRGAGVRPCYSPGTLELAVAAGTTDPAAYVVTVTGAGTYRYRVNPATRAVFGQAQADFTAMTSGTTEIEASPHDTIEVVKIESSKVTAVGYIEAYVAP